MLEIHQNGTMPRKRMKENPYTGNKNTRKLAVKKWQSLTHGPLPLSLPTLKEACAHELKRNEAFKCSRVSGTYTISQYARKKDLWVPDIARFVAVTVLKWATVWISVKIREKEGHLFVTHFSNGHKNLYLITKISFFFWTQSESNMLN